MAGSALSSWSLLVADWAGAFRERDERSREREQTDCKHDERAVQ